MPDPMSGADYRAHLARLQILPVTSAAAELLGISVRMSRYYASGQKPIPEKIAKLLRLLVAQRARSAARAQRRKNRMTSAND